MRLWYQSLTRAGAWPGYNAALRRLLERARDPGTEIEIHGIEKRGGIGDQYRYLEFIEAQEALENAERAAREGFDAFLIGNIGDPGLREAREIAALPVLGLCETSVHLACMMGASFALVAGNEKHATRIVENVARYGLRERLHGVRTMQVARLADLDRGFSDARAGDALVDEFTAAARAAGDAGAEVVIPAVGVLMVLLATRGIHSVGAGVPVLNGVLALLKLAESAVRMRALMGGHWTSRRATYAPPPPSQIEELRKAYGNVYPGIEPGKESQ
jgi:allantoin racemase